MNLKYLFRPITIGGISVTNRIAMPSLNHAYSTDGHVNDRLIAYYKARADGGVGMITIGGCAVHELGRSLRILCLYDECYNGGFRKLTAAIHETKTKVFAQLYHAGGYAKSKEIGAQALAPSAIANRYTREIPKEMTLLEIAEAEASFVSAALRAKNVGFDGVEIIGSAGYLIAEFLSPLTNRRTDQYGGNCENRERFLLNVISGIRAAVGEMFPIIVRLSGNDFVKEGNTNENAVRLAQRLEEVKVDAINVTGGWHESKIPQATGELPSCGYAYLAARIKKALHIPVIASNRINDPIEAERIIALGFADVVNMGRALLADPELPNKARTGKIKEIRRCIACGQGCFDRRFSGQDVCCMINYQAGREWEMNRNLPKISKKVLVVGGGVAGMEFAIRAAEQGHKVTVWEKSAQLGGQLVYAAKPIGKQDFRYLTEYQTHMLAKHHVSVELSQEASLEKIMAFQPDVVVIATGSTPIPALFPILPDAADVVQAQAVLAGECITGQRVVVVGGGAVGCETAVLLADQGTLSAEQTKFLMRHNAESDEFIHELLRQSTRQVTIVEMRNDVGMDIGISTRWGVKQQIQQLGITCMTETKVVEISAAGVYVQTADGKRKSLAADTVVLAIGSRSCNQLAQEINGKIPEVYLVGDAVEPGKILRCIQDSNELAMKI